MLIELRKERRRLLLELKQVVAAHLWESGFVTGRIGSSEPLWLWMPSNPAGKVVTKIMALRGVTLTGFMGFIADGVIIDAEGAGLVTRSFRSLPIEDLYVLLAKARTLLAVPVKTAV